MKIQQRFQYQNKILVLLSIIVVFSACNHNISSSSNMDSNVTEAPKHNAPDQAKIDSIKNAYLKTKKK